jgi:hypothetical protein
MRLNISNIIILILLWTTKTHFQSTQQNDGIIVKNKLCNHKESLFRQNNRKSPTTTTSSSTTSWMPTAAYGDQSWYSFLARSKPQDTLTYLNIICIDVLCTRNIWIHIFQFHPSMIDWNRNNDSNYGILHLRILSFWTYQLLLTTEQPISETGPISLLKSMAGKALIVLGTTIATLSLSFSTHK